VFEPGCFDHFDGTQEELDGLMAEIQDMFANMTPEELKAQSRAIDIDELAEALDNDPELLEAMKHISDLDKRNLQ
jgi:tRNA A37 N6-isopentenylltransferase MiaA